jgi:tRNA(Arg) A34 adenosine deaminase TadA
VWETYIRNAIALAARARAQGEDPFGALLVDPDGGVVASAADESIRSADPTRHAELAVLSGYCVAERTMGLPDFTLVTSAEPCLMCAGAAHWAKVSRVVYSVPQAALQRGSGGRAKPCATTLAAELCFEIVGPILEEEGLAVFDGYEWVPKRLRITESVE